MINSSYDYDMFQNLHREILTVKQAILTLKKKRFFSTILGENDFSEAFRLLCFNDIWNDSLYGYVSRE